uniref:Mid2 domain-containing protein n=1 Tax=Mycena chlorophos TaxID=658473 RepID=A0ABQ0LMM0_MYCCL|nr:predicted protein [Mycena chlorophos]
MAAGNFVRPGGRLSRRNVLTLTLPETVQTVFETTQTLVSLVVDTGIVVNGFRTTATPSSTAGFTNIFEESFTTTFLATSSFTSLVTFTPSLPVSTSSSASTTSASASATGTSDASNAMVSPSESTRKTVRVPVEAVVGAGIGAALVVLICVGLAIVLCLRRRRRRKYHGTSRLSIDPDSESDARVLEDDEAALAKAMPDPLILPPVVVSPTGTGGWSGKSPEEPKSGGFFGNEKARMAQAGSVGGSFSYADSASSTGSLSSDEHVPMNIRDEIRALRSQVLSLQLANLSPDAEDAAPPQYAPAYSCWQNAGPAHISAPMSAGTA